MGRGLAKLDLDVSRLYFPEASCSDVMKDLTQEFQVHEWGGVGRGSWEVSQPQLPSAPVGWSPATLMLEGLGQCCSLLVDASSLTRKWLVLLSGTRGVRGVSSLFSAELWVGVRTGSFIQGLIEHLLRAWRSVKHGGCRG